MKKNSKKVLIMGILVVVMIIVVTGVSLAFFNYTRTGTANTLSVGRISFNHTQDGKIELTNVFPSSSSSLNSTNSDTVTINITGDTTYSEGIEYKVTLEQVNNTINGKEVPISIKATATNLGTASTYWYERGGDTSIYTLNEAGDVYDGKYVAVGYIPEGSTGVDGSIDITAYIDTNKVAISDTYDETESDNMGTTNDWVMGREVFTTDEWNSFNSSNQLSFKVKVEANEGIWVEPEKFLTMKNLRTDSNWTAIRANITSIEFHKDGVAPTNYVTSFDVTNTTSIISDLSKGRITLYTVDDELGNNTYKAIVVANDTIYAPESSLMFFVNMSNLIEFNSKNFRVDNVINMSSMFANCTNLKKIDSLSIWNTSNVTTMSGMFKDVSLSSYLPFRNWNVGKVNIFSDMFNATSSSTVTTLEGLENWNVSSATNMNSMFQDNASLTDASAINDWNINPSAKFTKMFANTPVHPEFTKVAGTWDAYGDFVPNA